MKCTNILVFGGAFNPISKAHLEIVNFVKNQYNITKVIFLPHYVNYLNTPLMNTKHQLKMLELAIQDYKDFEIETYELKNKCYTYKSLRYLKNKYQDANLYYLIGEDKLINLKNCPNFNKVKDYATILVYPRVNAIKVDLDYVTMLEAKLVNGSSGLIRHGNFNLTTNEIKDYIIKNNLYLEEQIEYKLDDLRYKHCLSVAMLAYKMAKSNHLNSKKAYVAGILHDYAKGLDKEVNAAILKVYFNKYLPLPSYCYHAFSSAYLAKVHFKIDDEAILKAIQNHCKVTKNMSKLEKLIYACDKLDELRPFASSLNEIRNLAYKDINKAFVLVLNDQNIAFKKENKEVDVEFEYLLNYYQNQLEK